jgi:hypothetical protein
MGDFNGGCYIQVMVVEVAIKEMVKGDESCSVGVVIDDRGKKVLSMELEVLAECRQCACVPRLIHIVGSNTFNVI